MQFTLIMVHYFPQKWAISPKNLNKSPPEYEESPSVAVFKGGVVGGPMPPMPSELKEALDQAQELIESGKPDDALDILRTTGWKAAQTNSQKVSVTRLASEAMISKGDLDMGNRKKHWQRAYKNYQQALKLEPSNKDIRRSKNKLHSMMVFPRPIYEHTNTY